MVVHVALVVGVVGRAVGGTSVGRAFVDRRTCDSENGWEGRTVAFTNALVGIEWICSYYWSSEADESAVIAQGSVGSKRSASHRNAERKARRKLGSSLSLLLGPPLVFILLLVRIQIGKLVYANWLASIPESAN